MGAAGLLLGVSALTASVTANAASTQPAPPASWSRIPTHAPLFTKAAELQTAVQREFGRTRRDNSVATTGNKKGFSVAIAGDVAVVGAPGQSNNIGAAFIWEYRAGQSWQQAATLPDPRNASNDEYGSAVAISSTSAGTYVAVGSNEQNTEPNVVYTYKESGSAWDKQATLTDPDGYSSDKFGRALAISGNVLAIGAPGVKNNSGTVYIYNRSGTKWNQQAARPDPGDASGDMFGRSVSTSDSKVLAGADGISYVYNDASGSWPQSAVLKNPGSASDNFGYAVNITAGTAVVGAPGGSPPSAGAAYVFTAKGSTWSSPVKLTAPSGTQGDEFGNSVTEANGSLLIGMPVYGAVNCGTTFAYSLIGGAWTFQGQVPNPSCSNGDEYGFAAALSGATAVVGAPETDGGAGAVFFAALPPTSPEATLSDPSGTGVRAVTFSPDDSTIVTGDANGNTYLWGSGSGAPTATLHNPDGYGTSGVAYSPDGKTLVTSTINSKHDAGDIYVWNLSSGKVSATLHDPDTSGIDAVAFSPNGTTVAAADRNGNTYLWDISTDKILVTLTDPDSQGVNDVVFTSDGDFLDTADGNGDAYVWESSGTLDATLPDPGSKGVNGVAFSPDPNGSMTATADGNGNVYLWEPPHKLVATLSGPGNEAVSDVTFSPDGKTLAAATTNGTLSESGVSLWDVATGSLIATFHDPGSDATTRLAYSSSGDTIAVGDANTHAYLWAMSWRNS